MLERGGGSTREVNQPHRFFWSIGNFLSAGEIIDIDNIGEIMDAVNWKRIKEELMDGFPGRVVSEIIIATYLHLFPANLHLYLFG